MPRGQLLPKRQIAAYLRVSFWSRRLQLAIRALITLSFWLCSTTKKARSALLSICHWKNARWQAFSRRSAPKDVTAAGKVRIFAGGPVQPDIGFVIHSSDYRQPETVAIDSRTAMTSSRRNFCKISATTKALRNISSHWGMRAGARGSLRLNLNVVSGLSRRLILN